MNVAPIKIKRFILALILTIFTFSSPNSKPPKLTIVMVIDQFAYDYIKKLKDNFNYSFKFLINNGIFYSNAHHPHGAPTTATGHTAIGTGCYAKEHGIVLNKWRNFDGKKVYCDDDNTKKASVFNENSLCDYGKSAKNIMVNGLADQFILSSKFNKSFSLSHKSRAAIGMGGHLSKNIWFDENTGLFTSSKAFFNKLPGWLKRFNQKKKIRKMKDVTWRLMYPRKSKYYKLKNININEKTDYKFAGYRKSIISPIGGKTRTNPKLFSKGKHYDTNTYEIFLRTPFANKILLDLSKECLNTNFNKSNKEESFLLWVSLSPLDKLGHIYGPQSLEITDMIYHLDKQINDFFRFAQKIAGKNNVIFVLTADHGVEQIPEIMQLDGYKNATRIMVRPLINQMNKIIKNKHNIENLVIDFRTSMFYFNQKIFNTLDKEIKDEILNDLKLFLKRQKGVKNIWDYNELKNSFFSQSQIKNFYKMQLYPGRSGQLICQPERYCVFTQYPTGTSHRSGYDYNTHVPLILYQKNKLEKQKKNNRVWIPQLPVTLAKILEVAKPPSSTFTPLPGI